MQKENKKEFKKCRKIRKSNFKDLKKQIKNASN